MSTQKQNPRVMFTKNALLHAFFTLLEEKSLQNITVTDICKEADINRSTFYVHYKDVRSLIEEIEDSIIDNMNGYVTNALDSNDPMQTLLIVLRTMKSNSKMIDIFHKLFSEHGDPMFMARVNATIHDIFRKLWADSKYLGNNTEQEAIYSFIVGGNVALIVNWLKNESDLEPEQIVSLIETLSTGALKQYEN